MPSTSVFFCCASADKCDICNQKISAALHTKHMVCMQLELLIMMLTNFVVKNAKISSPIKLLFVEFVIVQSIKVKLLKILNSVVFALKYALDQIQCRNVYSRTIFTISFRI